MRTPRKLSLALSMGLAALAGCASVTSQESGSRILASEAVIQELLETRFAFAALTVEDQGIVHLWLHANCAVGFEDRRTQFVALRAGTETALVEAFRMGPPVAFLQQLANTRRADFEGIQQALKTEDRAVLGTELAERLDAVSEDRYVTDGIVRAIANYRIAALDGLALVGSQSALAWLEGAAPKVSDPELKRVAERTIAAMQQRPHR